MTLAAPHPRPDSSLAAHGRCALTAVVAAGVVGLVIPGHLGLPPLAWAVTASTAFVLISVTSAYPAPSMAACLTVGGLVFCWLGDVLGQMNFTYGAMAFTGAHGLFIAAFAARGLAPRRAAVGLGCGTAVTMVAGFWLLPHVQAADLPLVLSYMVIITAMVACAAGIRDPDRRLTLGAAILFYLSDIAVARWRFVAPGPINALFCYPLYYAACTMLAFTPRQRQPGSVPPSSGS